MRYTCKKYHWLFIFLLLSCAVQAQQKKTVDLIEKNFLNPPESAKPWVFWYWMHAAVSKAGITADLEAMKQVGIGGAYLMPIQDTVSTIPFQPTVRQLTPEWWEMVRFSMQEAKRLNLKLAMHVSDGFALAGGPWITPELSMQKLVWTKRYIKAGSNESITLEQPESEKGYYKDVAVFAYPANSSNAFSAIVQIPTVTASNGTKPQFLSFPSQENKQSFKSDTACWIQYKYPEAFTCRSIKIHVGGNNHQAQRLIVQTSDDGENFTTIKRLTPPRSGWQDTDEDYTFSIPSATAKYFRFLYDKAGTEPGAEDLDAAKWKPSLKVMSIYLSDEPVINQFESKNGSVWRVAANTTDSEIPIASAVPLKNIIDLTNKMDAAGNLSWKPTSGDWVIVRIGHTSTGHTNATGGAGAGLECDKFNATAIKLQFDNWFAKAFSNTDAALAKEVLKVFHVDSWECGSQNWSSNFKNEFFKRTGYDLMPYLLVMTGVPITDAATSEKVLHDVRQTIAELVNDVFYATLKNLAHSKGCTFSAESVAPTMVSDGLLHYKNVDLPMGEFWLNSPTHDKPNDMLDAISGAHVYGKNIIGAESFTSVRMNWGEHPGNLKAIGDRNFALGINKMVLHVFAHNPFIDKKPGVTLDGVGIYFQRDQTWFKQSKAWIEYLTRCQALLQLGKPVVDIGVFIGEEIPSRSILPDRLISSLPGLFGKEKVATEKTRLQNVGQPMRQIPDGVSHSANMADPENYIDALRGYQYDCFNPDVLMQMKVVSGRVVTPGGASYAVLVIPGRHPMNPNAWMSEKMKIKLKQLADDGGRIMIDSVYNLHQNKNFIKLPWNDESLEKLGIKRDLFISSNFNDIAWTHRKIENTDIYFISNQKNENSVVSLYCNSGNRKPEIIRTIQNAFNALPSWSIEKGMTSLYTSLAPYESIFLIFRNPAGTASGHGSFIKSGSVIPFSKNNWNVRFESGNNYYDTIFNDKDTDATLYKTKLQGWHQSTDNNIRYFSGTAKYVNSFQLKKNAGAVILTIDSVCNIATVKVNGINCGTLWTPPYEFDITKAAKVGDNKIEIEVTNTWHNRLIGDNLLPAEKRITWTTAPFRLKDKPLEPSGIIGNVSIILK